MRQLHPISSVSVETNPDHLTDDLMSSLKTAGVNRLSVGVQSFDDTLLRQMERLDQYGSGDQIRHRLSRIAGSFDTLNVDMIFNFPNQSKESLDTDLATLTCDLQIDQASFYPLMTSRSTLKPIQHTLGTVDYRQEREYYALIAGHMLDAGYARASAWCFSKQPALIDEYITTQEEYLGLGSGAFSYLGGSFYASTFSINHYVERAMRGKSGIVKQRALSTRERMRYWLLTRMLSGCVDLAAADDRFAGQFRRVMRPEITGLRLCGAASLDGDKLRLTETGYYLWVLLMREFFTGVNNFRDEMRHNIALERE